VLSHLLTNRRDTRCSGSTTFILLFPPHTIEKYQLRNSVQGPGLNVRQKPKCRPARHSPAGFMTRNNLSGHLSWLLKNVALSKPTAREFPTTSDTSSFRFSQSQSQSADTPAANLSQATTASASTDKRISQVQVSGSSNGLPKREEALQDKEVVLEDDSMGRLNLSLKSKKTSLLSQNGQLATPSINDPETKQRLIEPLKSNGT
jgi:hypothetical protein